MRGGRRGREPEAMSEIDLKKDLRTVAVSYISYETC